MYKRPHHQRIAKVLGAFDPRFLQEARCFFGGGTAIALMLDEYRTSLDVDFLCASRDGYRSIRETVLSDSFGKLLRAPLVLGREIRMDSYAIRAFVVVDDAPIKIEIVSEGRVELNGRPNPQFGIPTLTKQDLFTQKLLANSDRGTSKGNFSRDIIDLAMMINTWGPIPAASWKDAEGVAGKVIRSMYTKAVALLSEADYFESCCKKMEIDAKLMPVIKKTLLSSIAPERGSRSPGP